MNKYLVAIRHFFSGYENFTVEAYNKAEAEQWEEIQIVHYGY